MFTKNLLIIALLLIIQRTPIFHR